MDETSGTVEATAAAIPGSQESEAQKKALSASEARKLKAQRRRKKVLKGGRDRLAYITGQAPTPPAPGSGTVDEVEDDKIK
jgi:hypothetical protein